VHHPVRMRLWNAVAFCAAEMRYLRVPKAAEASTHSAALSTGNAGWASGRMFPEFVYAVSKVRLARAGDIV